MWDYIKLMVIGVVVILSAIAANYARDFGYMVHAIIFMVAAGLLFIWTVRGLGERKAPAEGYLDGVVRAGVIATVFWGVVGFTVGV
ncbi:MAG TPA: cytochrome-c oxidase, cbb3-type subunit I, partial [Rhodobacteraceae bacterium]|nr:cytochrome-c oxidase, cbb3-type subunit I [Paracoccaceae bacterium]